MNSVWKVPETLEHIKVKPLDVTRKDGWTDDKGEFCLPLSDGYYIKFPKTKDALFGLYFHGDLISAASKHADVLQIAQDHHRYRIVTSLAQIPGANEVKALDLLDRMHHAATELAKFASYAEIVGAVSHNRKPIREWCDAVFEVHHEYAKSGLVDEDVALGLVSSSGTD
jgi:hypothetical protein